MQKIFNSIVSEIEKVILGKEEEIKLSLFQLFVAGLVHFTYLARYSQGVGKTSFRQKNLLGLQGFPRGSHTLTELTEFPSLNPVDFTFPSSRNILRGTSHLNLFNCANRRAILFRGFLRENGEA